MAMNRRPKVVGINHIALEVGNIDEAIAFYGRIFEFKLRGRTKDAAFVDMGDQFIALMEGRSEYHERLTMDELAREAGAKMIAGDFLDFLDPWGNRIQVVEYKDLQFTKTAAVLHAMGLQHLDKTTEAMQQLAAKGIMTGS